LKTLVIVNPKAGRRFFLGLVLSQLAAALARRGIEQVVARTRHPGHAISLMHRHRDGVDFVTVVGGDGTINEVVRGMGEEPLPLAVIPFGTANVLALELGIPTNPLASIEVALGGVDRLIDVGTINGRPFVLMVSAGIDAYAVHRLDAGLKRISGKLAYIVAGLASMARFRARRIRVSLLGKRMSDRGYLAVVSNSRFYGGRFRVTPGARIDDGELSVLLLKKRSLLDVLRLLFAVLTGTLPAMRDVALYRDKAIRLSSPRRIYMQTDGDKINDREADIRVRPRFLPVRVPRAG
jgi:YegS/Rv2252/BmrU family lipid kinase